MCLCVRFEDVENSFRNVSSDSTTARIVVAPVEYFQLQQHSHNVLKENYRRRIIIVDIFLTLFSVPGWCSILNWFVVRLNLIPLPGQFLWSMQSVEIFLN